MSPYVHPCKHMSTPPCKPMWSVTHEITCDNKLVFGSFLPFWTFHTRSQRYMLTMRHTLPMSTVTVWWKGTERFWNSYKNILTSERTLGFNCIRKISLHFLPDDHNRAYISRMDTLPVVWKSCIYILACHLKHPLHVLCSLVRLPHWLVDQSLCTLYW